MWLAILRNLPNSPKKKWEPAQPSSGELVVLRLARTGGSLMPESDARNADPKDRHSGRGSSANEKTREQPVTVSWFWSVQESPVREEMGSVRRAPISFPVNRRDRKVVVFRRAVRARPPYRFADQSCGTRWQVFPFWHRSGHTHLPELS